MGSLRVGAEHRPPPAADAPAVHAGGRPERGGAAAAGPHPVHAAAARPASQPAAGQLPPAAGDHPAAHGRKHADDGAATAAKASGNDRKSSLDLSFCARVCCRGIPEAAPGSSG